MNKKDLRRQQGCLSCHSYNHMVLTITNSRLICGYLYIHIVLAELIIFNPTNVTLFSFGGYFFNTKRGVVS